MKYKIKNKILKELIALTNADEKEVIRALITDKISEEMMVEIINKSILEGIMAEMEAENTSGVPITSLDVLNKITELKKSKPKHKKTKKKHSK